MRKFGFKIGYSIVIVLFLNACKDEMKFNKSDWNTSNDIVFPPPCRERMLKDLTSNYQLTGLKCAKLLELLGKPNGADSCSLFYDIEIDYGHDIDPVYVKSLNFKFSKDSVISSYSIEEYKK